MARKKVKKLILKSRKKKGLSPTLSKAELISKTKAELVALAKKKKIAVTAQLLKARLVAALLSSGKKKPAPTKKKSAKASPRPVAVKSIPPKRMTLKTSRPRTTLSRKKVSWQGPVTPTRVRSRPKTTPPQKRLSLPETDAGIQTGTVPPPPWPPSSPPRERPTMAALVKDPHWAYCYWELGTERAEVSAPVKKNTEGPIKVLRMWDKTDPRDEIHFDIHVQPHLKGFYVRVDEAREYQFEVGFSTPAGKFISLASSGTIRTPRSGVAPRRPTAPIPKEWRCSEENFTEIYALSHGLDVRLHGDTVLQMMHRGPAISSRGISSRRIMEEEGRVVGGGVSKKC